MNAERYRRLEQLFRGARGVDPAHLSSWLDEQCGDDVDLKAEVQDLLSHDTAPRHSFEPTPLARALDPSGTAERAGSEALPHWLPDAIGGFRVLRRIGEGGMGVVFEAEQVHPRRRVAIKVVRPGALSDRAGARFQVEARALGRLKHPGIAQIHEAGDVDTPIGTLPFFAMEFVDGRGILRYCAAEGLDRRARCALMAQVCDAIHAAHLQGVIHRDLKPANLLVDETGRVKVLDFGVALLTDSDLRVTTLGSRAAPMIGTLPYMSPEQAAGDPDGIDLRADVYSLGAVFYELLVGKPLVDSRRRSLPELARVVREEPPTPLRAVDRTLRGDLDTIVGKAVAKDRDARYASAAELAADIRRHLALEPIAARRPSWRYRTGRFVARHRFGVSLATVAVVALVAATVFSVAQMRSAQEAHGIAEREKRVALIEAFRATLAAAQANLEAGNVFATRQALDRVPERQRHWEWHYLSSQLDRAEALVDAPASVAAALEPGGRRLVTVSSEGTVRWLSPYTGRVSSSAACDLENIQRVVLSADGRRMAAIHGSGGRDVGLWELDPDRGLQGIVDGQLDGCGIDLALSGDGTRVAATTVGSAWIWEPETTVPVRWEHGIRPRAIAISADGTQVALVSDADGTGVYRLFDVARRRATPDLGRDIASLALSPDGSLAATGEVDGVVRLRRAETGSVLRRLDSSSDAPRILAFAGDGRTLAAAGTDGTIRLWDLDSTQQPMATLAGHTAPIRQLGFGASGTGLVSLDDTGSARIWSAAARPDPLILSGHFGRVIGVAVFPDGVRIVSGSANGELRFWDAASGVCYAAIPHPTAEMVSLCVAPDGARIATGHRGAVVLRNAASPADAVQLSTGTSDVVAVSFANDSQRLATLDAAGRTIVWDAADGTPVFEASAASAASSSASAAPSAGGCLAFADSGGRLATGRAGELVVHDAATGMRLRRLRVVGATAHTAAWIPRTGVVASGWSDGTIRLFDTNTGSVDAFSGSHDAVHSIAVSPDGSRLVAGSMRGAIEIWDLATARVTIELRWHDGPIDSLAFFPDGSRLISASADREMRVWESSPVHVRSSAAALMAELSEEMKDHVGGLFEDVPDPLQVAELLWRDPTLSEPRRRAALRWTLRPPVPDSDLRRDPFDGFALEFAGADQHVAAVDGSRALRMTDAFTIEAWIRPAPAEPFVEGAMLALRTIVNKEGEYQIAAAPNGQLHWTLAGPEGWIPWNPVRYAAAPGRWTHVALVRDAAEVRFFVDGRRVQTQRGPERIGDHHPTMNELRVGGRQHTPSSFVGRIDEVRVWEVARTDEQITSWMLRRLAGDEPGLLSAWSFDEGRGSIARDLTGRHPGAIVGPSWRATSREAR